MQTKKTYRLNQINALIKKKFGAILNQAIQNKPGTLISITSVKTSKDLQHTKIGISIFPTQKTDKTFVWLNKKLKHLKYLLHQQINLRFSPEIQFFIDKKAQQAEELTAVLQKMDQSANLAK